MIHEAEQGLRMIYDPRPEEVQAARVEIAAQFEQVQQHYHDQREATRSGIVGCLTCDVSPETPVAVTVLQPANENVAIEQQSHDSTPRLASGTQMPSVARRPLSDQRNRPDCLYCLGDHGLCQCHAFRYCLTGAQRRRFVVSYIEGRGGCLNCFRTTHMANECTFGGCKSCNGKKHNSLL